MTTKLSVSLPDEDVAFLDHESRSGAYASRSAVLHEAVRMLRSARLSQEYAEAFAEMTDEEISEWDSTLLDGIDPSDD